MKIAWTTHRHSTALQCPLPVQARPFRLAWTRTLSSSALQATSPVHANFINAIAPLHRPAPSPRSIAPPRGLAATHLHPDPRWSALQGLRPCKCVAAAPLPRLPAARHNLGGNVSFAGRDGWVRRGVSGHVRIAGGRETGALFSRSWNRGDYEKDLCDLHKSILQGGDI